MLSVQRIERLAESGQFALLLEAVSRNGRWLPLPVRLRLSDEGSVELAALGLALQRCAELTHLTDPAMIELGDRLAERLADVTSPRATPGAVAAAMGGLLALRSHAADCGTRLEAGLDLRIERALRQGAYSLFEAQSSRATGLIGDTIDAAILLWHLAEPLGLREALSGSVRLEDFEHACRRCGVWRDANVQAVMRLTGGAGSLQRATPVARPSGHARAA